MDRSTETALVRMRVIREELEETLKDTCGPIPRELASKIVPLLTGGELNKEVLSLVRSDVAEHLGGKLNAYQHKGYRVYSMNDYDWWASKLPAKEAEQEYMAFTGIGEDDQEDAEVSPLSLGQLLCLIFNDEENNTRRTFLAELKSGVDSGKHETGFFFASTES